MQTDSDEEAEGDDDEGGARPPSPPPLENLEEEEEDEQQDTDSTEKGGATREETKDKKRKKLTPDERVAAYNKKQREKRRQERREFQLRQEAALRELYRHEVLALLSCFVFPVLGAFLLHALRSQLTRPSEGLISDFNLTVFILAAEVRPLRHFLQLVQSRTLHLQRIVHANPYREEEERYRERRAEEEQEQNQVLSDLLARLESLEQQTMAASAAAAAATATAVAASSTSSSSKPIFDPNQNPNPHHNLASSSTATSYFSSPTSPSPPSSVVTSPKPMVRRSPSEAKRDRDQLLRELRTQLQPELDTLARALRRTHKQQTLLETQIVAKFRATDQRLSDAVSLASAAAACGGGGGGGGRYSGPRSLLFSGSSFNLPSAAHLIDDVWTTFMWASEAAVAAFLYIPRRATAAAAAIIALPLWAVQAILNFFGRWSSGGKSPRKGDSWSREGRKSRKAASTTSSAPILIVDGHLASRKSIRDLDYEYATVSSSGIRQSRMGLAT